MKLNVLVGVVIAFAIGIGIRTLVNVPSTLVVWLLLVSLGLGMVWRRSGASSPHLLQSSLFIIFIALGIFRAEVASWQFNHSALQNEVNQKIELEGVIIQEPDYREKSVNLYLETIDDKILVSADRLNLFSYGDKVRVKGELTKPESFVTDLGRTFNYPGYLLARGVEYKISFAHVTLIETGHGNPIIAGLLAVKKKFVTSLERVVPEPQVGLGEGLLLGIKSALGKDIEEDFRRSGIIHIVVLSGYNVMLVVSFFLLIFSLFLSPTKRVIAGVISIIAFALIVGLSATVVRASIMASLLLLAGVLGRRYDVLRALLLAGTVMLVINPYLLLFDIGFQLSFMATLGLILIVPHFEATAINLPQTFGIKDFFLATISTQIAVLPLLLYHMGEVSLVAIFVNVLVLPIVPAAMLLTFFTGLVGLFSVPLASAFGWLAMLSLSYILLVAHWFAALPIATLAVSEFSPLFVLLSYLLMGVVYWRFKRRELNDGWTVEEEFEKAGALSVQNKLNNAPASKPDLPIFFR